MCFRKRTEKWIQGRGKHAQAIMKEIEMNKVKFTFFLRILPLPIGLQNCMLSVAPIPIWMYQVVSGLGLLVKQVPEIYMGTTLNDITEVITGEEDFSFLQLVPILLGIVAIIIFVLFIVYMSRRVIARLKETEEQELDQTAEEIIAQLEQTEEPLECEVFCEAPSLDGSSGLAGSLFSRSEPTTTTTANRPPTPPKTVEPGSVEIEMESFVSDSNISYSEFQSYSDNNNNNHSSNNYHHHHHHQHESSSPNNNSKSPKKPPKKSPETKSRSQEKVPLIREELDRSEKDRRDSQSKSSHHLSPSEKQDSSPSLAEDVGTEVHLDFTL